MDQSIRHFAAPMGKATLELTCVTSLVLLFVGGLELFLGLRRKGATRSVLLVTGAMLIIGCCAASLLKIRGYDVDGQNLVIHYGFWKKEIPLASITEAAVKPDAFRGATRTSANGGLWSFLGNFNSAALGDFKVYVSDLKRMVVVTTQSGKFVVSPDDPDAFISTVNQRKGKGA